MAAHAVRPVNAAVRTVPLAIVSPHIKAGSVWPVSCHGWGSRGGRKLRAPGDASASAWFWRTGSLRRRGPRPWEVGKNSRPEPCPGVSSRPARPAQAKVPGIRPGGNLPTSGSNPLLDAAWMPILMACFPDIRESLSVSQGSARRLSGSVLPKHLALESRKPPDLHPKVTGWLWLNEVDARCTR